MPCKKGMNGCHRACLHRALVTDYHVAREADELRRENVTRGHATENAEYDGPMITFKEYLIGTAGKNQQQPEPARGDVAGAA